MAQARLKIKVIPKASQNALVGWLGDELKIMVTAAPQKGKANKAVIELLAKTLGVAKQSIEIVAGASSARKTIRVDDIDERALRQAINIEISDPRHRR